MEMNEQFETLQDQTCPAIGYQSVGVCVPVTVTPFANTGKTVTKCCGNAVVKSGTTPCPGIKNGLCSFTIGQNVCVAIPVNFGATAVVGDTYVDCLGASETDICTNCTDATEGTTPPNPEPKPEPEPEPEPIADEEEEITEEESAEV